MEKSPKKISILQIVVFGISFVVAFFAANYFFSDNEDSNSILERTSKEMNETMPKMIDTETRLDSTSVENTTLSYHYTLINFVKDSSNLDLKTVKLVIKQKAQDNLDNNSAMKEYRENEISLKYIYRDKNQDLVFDYTVKHNKK